VIVRSLRRLVKINLIMSMEYRGDLVLFMLNNVAIPVVSLLVWLAVADSGVSLPLDRTQLVTYYLLLSIVSMFTFSWLAELLADDIRLGSLSPWLLRPAPILLSYLANNLSEKILKLVALLPMLVVVSLCFPGDFRLPLAPLNWLLFLLALPQAAALAFLIDVIIAALAFWVDDVRGLSRVRVLVATFLSGQVVPLALFPASLTGFLRLQPFRYTLSYPLEVLTGQLSPSDLRLGFALQIGYLALGWLIYRWLWRRGLRSYAAVGA